MTIVKVIGTIHEDTKAFSYKQLISTIQRFRPDVVAVEMRSQDLIEQGHYLKEHYPGEMVLAKETFEHQCQVYGFDWRGKAIENKRIEHWHDETPSLWQYAQKNAEIMAHIKLRKKMLLPFFETYNFQEGQSSEELELEAIFEKKMEMLLVKHGYDELLQYYRDRERMIQHNVAKIIERHIGDKIVILTGVAHRAKLVEFIEKHLSIEVIL